MNVSIVSIELLVGAAILAGWFEARIGERRPASLSHRIGHAAAAFVLLQASSAALAHLLHEGASRGTSTALLFVLFLPALTYAFVAGLWLLRTLSELAR
jgi:hypothetical protein